MKQTRSIIPLIEKWETYTTSGKGNDIYDFAGWLLAQKQEKANPSALTNSKAAGHSAEVAILLTKLQRYLSMNVKPQVKKLGFTKEHEYNFLYQVSKMDKPNKNDLSKENMLELSTGRDIVRRLINKGLITEKEHPEDKRAMQISMTAQGKKLLEKSFEMLAVSFADFLGDLTFAEQEELTTLLKKLNAFHARKTKKDILFYL